MPERRARELRRCVITRAVGSGEALLETGGRRRRARKYVNGGVRAGRGVRGMVPGKGFKSESEEGSRVKRLGIFAIRDEADMFVRVVLVTKRETSEIHRGSSNNEEDRSL